MDVVLRDHDRRTVVGDLVLHPVGLELVDHRRGIGRGEVAIERGIARGGRPTEDHEPAEQQGAGADQHDRLLGGGEVAEGVLPAVQRRSHVLFHAHTCIRMIRSEEHTSELQSLMRISYAVFCLKKKNRHTTYNTNRTYEILTI